MGYTTQTLLLWEQHQSHPYPYTIQVEANAEFNAIQKSLPDFKIQFYIQLLFTTSGATLPDNDVSTTEVTPAATTSTEPAKQTLETIPEETEADLQETDFLVSVYDQQDLQLVQAGKQASRQLFNYSKKQFQKHNH